jgi:hypothetical protein
MLLQQVGQVVEVLEVLPLDWLEPQEQLIKVMLVEVLLDQYQQVLVVEVLELLE